MNVQRIPIDQLNQPPKNVRIHSPKQMDEYCRSIRKFGQTKPIICDEGFTILAGNGLYLALKACGKTEAWCNIMAGLSEADKKKLMLADNRVYELGITDHDAIDEILLDLNGSFDIPGFDDSMLEMLTKSLQEVNESIDSYGRFDSAEVEKIRQNEADEHIPGETQEHGRIPEDGDTARRTSSPNAQRAERIVCPYCGKEICL